MPRPTCSRCRRPATHCWCRFIEPVQTRTRLIFLQHLRESRVRIGTARMAHLALPNSEFHVGTAFPHDPGPRSAVLFPDAEALPPEQLRGGEPWNLIVVDGTWSQARKLVERDPILRSLPRIAFRPERPGNYRIRREPTADSLATVEAVAEVLGRIEGGPERFQSMIRAFTYMVDQQIAAAARSEAARFRKRSGPKPEDPALSLLREAGERLVLLHAEANAHPRNSPLAGEAELVHLVALRPGTGQAFERVLAPRRPLAARAPERLGLEPEAFLRGDEVEDALGSFRSFLGEEDIVGTWGTHPLHLLEAEGLRAPAALDLRVLLARKLRRKPGPLEKLVGPVPTPTPGRGRAGRTVASLQALLPLLQQ